MNIQMPPQLVKIQELLDAKEKRERILIFLSVLALIFMIWNFAIQKIFDQEVDAAQLTIQKLQQDIIRVQNEIAAEAQQLSNDPNKVKKERVGQLQADIVNVDNQLQQLGNRLIKAEQLPGALQEVLLKTAKVKLLHVGTYPAKELMLSGLSLQAAVVEGNANAATGDLTAGVYQHLVEIKVSGSFAEIVQLVLSLEQLPWRFYWQSLDYKVKQYPNAEVILRVYTLSAEEGLLGV